MQWSKQTNNQKLQTKNQLERKTKINQNQQPPLPLIKINTPREKKKVCHNPKDFDDIIYVSILKSQLLS